MQNLFRGIERGVQWEKEAKSKKIELFLRTYEQIYGNYYLMSDPRLEAQLTEHIILLNNAIKIRNDLEIHIIQYELDDSKKFELALYNSITDLLKGLKKEFRANLFVATISLALGILIGLLATSLSDSNQQFSSVMIIAVWVFIWYSVEKSIFDNVALQIKKRRLKKIIRARIYFVEAVQNEG
ncbi:hypothetical protein [Listeria riparia]|nr:hypothetical protein [Listeria riparia]